LVCGLLHHLVSLVWINKRNGLDGVVSIIFSFMYGLVWFWGGSRTIGRLTYMESPLGYFVGHKVISLTRQKYGGSNLDGSI
jgi:hypothetical protein